MTFQELGLAEPLLRAVAAQGYTIPTPIQLQAIPHVIAGRDLLGCAQTGTGKTAAFALPILHRMSRGGGPQNRRGPIRVLVLGPTRELVAQIGDSFQTYGRYSGLRQAVVFGGVSQHPQTRALQKGVDVLIATPGRLLDLMAQGFIDLGSVEVFVLDEADRMLDMGFLPDLRRVIAKLPVKRQSLFFSATMPEEIVKLADTILRAPIRVRIPAVKANTPLIEQSVFFVPRQQKSRLLASVLTSSLVTRALVFTRTKHGADGVVRRLSQSGIRAAAIHGNKSQQARQRTLSAFKDDDAAVLVATDIASRGIDVEGISHVVNYDLPREPETYVHRIGRTGRAGAAGTAISFCDDEERQHLAAIERLIGRSLAVAGRFPAGPAANRPPTSAARSGGHCKKRSFPHARRR
jgi:ATP-dependent RNA helicase RhlE